MPVNLAFHAAVVAAARARELAKPSDQLSGPHTIYGGRTNYVEDKKQNFHTHIFEMHNWNFIRQRHEMCHKMSRLIKNNSVRVLCDHRVWFEQKVRTDV
jgi:hypothetical protein